MSDLKVEAPVTRHNVLGVGISSINMELAESLIYDGVATPGTVGYVTVTGVHGVMESQGDEALKKIHNNSYLSTPDGMPMVWLGRWQGLDHVGRVYGPDLMKLILENGAQRGLRHFFFGGGEGVAQQLKARFEGSAEVAGIYSPPFRPLTESEELDLLADLKKLRPHCVWVGLSTPKQERFMADFIQKYKEELSSDDQGVLFFGVGAAFDFHIGAVKQAPAWIQQSGFEWLFRVCMEPRRLWKRYAVNNFRFILKILLQMLELQKYDLKK